MHSMVNQKATLYKAYQSYLDQGLPIEASNAEWNTSEKWATDS